MADIPLKSFTFPGLSDRYTTPVVDNTLAVAGAAADAKKTGDEISGLKNDLNQFPNGTYPNMSVGNADQLTATVGIEDNTPYLFRTSGGSNDIGDREDVRKIVGGTIVNNQLFNFPQQNTSNGVTLTFENGVVTLSGTATSGYCSFFTARITGGHKILVDTKVVSNPDNLTITFGSLNAQGHATIGSSSITNANNLAYASGIGIEGYGGTGTVFNNVKFQCVCTDLTKDFGTAIADYVYSLEQATAGAGVAWLKKYFPKQFDSGYQAYDAGSMQSVSGLTEHKMVGFNQFDADSAFEGATGITKNGDSFTGSANTFANFTNIAGWDKIKYISGLTYYGRVYITVPNSGLNWAAVEWVYTDETKTTGNQILTNSSGVSYALSNPNKTISHFRITYGSNGGNPITVKDININLHWDGEKDGTYEPYKTWSYALDDSITLRGIPKVDASGNLYYDGDEYLPDGTVNRRFGIVDMGTLNYGKTTHATFGEYFWASVADLDIKLHGSYGTEIYPAICSKYPMTTRSSAFVDKTCCMDGSSIAVTQLQIKDSAYTDAATFKTAMSGVYLIYEKNTPTIETAEPYQSTQIVDDFGTEEFILAEGAFPVPVGHNTMYQNNLRAKLEMSPDSPDGDGLYVVQQESGENTYVPLASTATIQDILTRLTALENA